MNSLPIKSRWRARAHLRRIFPMLAAAAAISGLAAGCSSSASQTQKPDVAVTVFTARPRPLARQVRAEGVLYPWHEVVVVPKISAPVEKFLVNRGDRVRRGQLLAVLDNADLKAAAVRDRGLYEQAQAQYRQATTAALPVQLRQARGAVATARQQYKAARQLYVSSKSLYAQGALAGNQLRQSEVGYVTAKTQLAQANINLEKLLGVGRSAQMQIAAGQLAAAKGAWQAAEALVQYSEIRSPINGIVTDRPLFPGQLATPATPLMTIMDLRRVIVRAPLAPGLAQGLHPGMPAVVRDAGVRAPGRVTVVSPALDLNSTTLQVWVEAANPHLQFHPGDSATMTITASQPRPMLAVPRSAILTSENGATAVMVVGPDHKARRVPVRLGIRQGNWVALQSGIAAGAQVISSGSYGLPNGTRVRVIPPA